MSELSTRKRTRWLAIGSAALLCVALLAAGAYMVVENKPSGKLQRYTLRPDDPQVVSVGARIYAQQCATCHGVRGEGQPDWRERGPDGLLPAPPHDPSGHTRHHPDSQLFAITKFGLAKLIDQPDYKTAMPVYGGVLSDDEIVAVLSWIKAQWPPDVRARHDEINRTARKAGL